MSSTLTRIDSKIAYMSTLQDRMAELISETKLSVGEIALIAGVSSSAASQWKDGPTKSIKIVPATRISEATGFSAMWLSTGVGPKKRPVKTLASENDDLTNLSHALNLISNLINSSELKGSMILSGAFASFSQEPSNKTVRDMLEQMLTSKHQHAKPNQIRKAA